MKRENEAVFIEKFTDFALVLAIARKIGELNK